MDWKFLYTSMDGRIGRKQFWIAAIVLAVVSIVISLVIGSALGVSMFGAMMAGGVPDADAMLRMSTMSGWAGLVTFVIFAWPAMALMIKRRHDRGNAGNDVRIYFGLSALLVLLQALGIGYGVQDYGGVQMVGPDMWLSIISVLIGIFALYLLVVVGFLKGDAGDNEYGPNPLAGA